MGHLYGHELQFPRATTFRSEKYLNFIREHPCAHCGTSYPSHAHHEGLGKNIMGGKPPDTHAIPLCWSCHAARHHYGISFWENYDIKGKIIEYLTKYIDLFESGKGYDFGKYAPKGMGG